jgi:hypothetical protein
MTQNVRTNDEAVTGSKQLFFFIFHTFEMDTTNYRAKLVENVKKSQKSTHPVIYSILYNYLEFLVIPVSESLVAETPGYPRF